MTRRVHFATALFAAGLVLAAGAAVSAQTSGTQTEKKSSTAKKRREATGGGAQGGQLSAADRRFVMHAAEGGMAEVELGKLATEKASNDQVKQFGQRMVDDHGKANDELKQLATNKGVTVPTELAAKDKALRDKLSNLSGASFDRSYMNHMVMDHKKDVAEFRKASQSATDADVKAFASKTLPVLEEHLKQAESVQGAVKSEAKPAGTAKRERKGKAETTK